MPNVQVFAALAGYLVEKMTPEVYATCKDDFDKLARAIEQNQNKQGE